MEWIWQADRALQGAVNKGLWSPQGDTFFQYVTYLGLDQLLLPLILALLIVKSTRRCGWVCFAAYAVAGLSSVVLKQLIERLRPSNFAGTLVAPDERVFHSSFPSGHTTIAFAVAFALLLSWPGKRRVQVGIVALNVALWVGLSRIYRGVHWPTDVLAGLLLGFIGAVVARLLIPAEAETPRPSALPASDPS